jgi:predicted XRE-type DNA-binding protein
MVDRKKNRSDVYQHILLESPCSPEMLVEIADSDGVISQLGYIYNEELLELKEQLKKEFWRIVQTQLTSRQREVITLVCEGKTQTEIAKILKVNQSSITKSINGNCDYKNKKRVYGGAKRKMKKIASQDAVIQDILFKIREIQSDFNF